jgi:16S rRNA (cytosine967-C5)-methyltransferase
MTARDHALRNLDGRRLPGWPVNLLKRFREKSPADPRDVALAERIYIGVVKNLLLLQDRIEHYSGKRLKQVDPLVQKILAIGLYQLGFLDRIPASAAVNEAVGQAKRFGRARAAGFVNAVLRNATRQPVGAGQNPGGDLTADNADIADYAEKVLSHPRELFEKISELLGWDAALKFCRHDNAEPPTLVRVLDGVEIAALQADGLEIQPHERAGIFVVGGGTQKIFADWARRGLAQVQDVTAAAVVDQLQLAPGMRVLDRCAGRGTKTLQILQRVGGSGNVVAADASGERCESLKELLAERGVGNVAVHLATHLRSIANVIPDSFDRVLIDVPCSNSGVLARRPEARYAQDDRRLKSLSKLQREILEDTAPFLAAGGLLIYSTCSIWPSENELLIGQFLSRFSDFHLLKEGTIWPSFETDSPFHYHDGGYIALLRKR